MIDKGLLDSALGFVRENGFPALMVFVLLYFGVTRFDVMVEELQVQNENIEAQSSLSTDALFTICEALEAISEGQEQGVAILDSQRECCRNIVNAIQDLDK